MLFDRLSDPLAPPTQRADKDMGLVFTIKGVFMFSVSIKYYLINMIDSTE